MELRLIPVVAFATASLLAVKVVAILQFDGRLPFEAAVTKSAPATTAEGTNELATISADDDDITGSTSTSKDKPSGDDASAGNKASSVPPGMAAPAVVPGGLSPAERALFEKLGARRQDLDARARDLDLRENLLKDAEKKLQNRIDELKDIENRINNKGGEQMARLKNLVLMYEGMKPKDAARIFEKLDPSVLADLAGVMNPKKLSDVLAQMDAEAAQRLTVELARRNTGNEQGLPSTDLQKIEGRPGT